MTVRLGMAALAQYEAIDGYATGHGMKDIRLLALDRFCNFVWWLATRNANEQEQAKMRAQLWRPPPPPPGKAPERIDPRSPWSAENEAKALAGLKAGLGLTTKPTSAAPAPEPAVQVPVIPKMPLRADGRRAD